MHPNKMHPNNKNNKVKNTSYIVFIGIMGAFAGILFGMDTGVISGALPLIKNVYKTSDTMEEWITSGILIGAFIGAIGSNWLCRYYGRKTTLLICGVIYIIGSILSAVSISPFMLVWFRILLGLAVGMSSYVSPLYLSEISPKKIRGRLITLYQFMITVGILIAYLTDALFTYFDSWRWMLGIAVVPAVILFIGAFFLPKSPRWLFLKGKKERAIEILKTIHSKDEAKIEASELELVIKNKKSSNTFSWLSKGFFKRVLFLGIVLQLLQQFSGINATIYYAPIMFAKMGFGTPMQIMWITVIIGAVNVLSTIFTIVYIDKFGRRSILMTGLLIMIISCALIAICLLLQGKAWSEYCVVIFILTFIIGFAISMGPIVWIICAEIFPLKARDLGITITTSANWVGDFLVVFTFLSILKNIGAPATFFIFAAINLLALIIVLLFVPETKGVSLEHIEENLISGKALRKLGY